MSKRHNTSSQQSAMFRPTEVPRPPEGYYSGDQPNPNLRAFVERFATAYNAENDDYSVQPFNKTLHIGNRRSPINDLHICNRSGR